jgi:hypothetical protein
MSHLIESILDKNYVVAESHLNEKLNSIMEKKLYEKKRMVAAQMDEVFGGLSPEQIEARKKAGYRKASDVLGDPWSERKKKIPLPTKSDEKKEKKKSGFWPDMSKEKRIGEEALDEAGLGFGAQAAHGMTPSEKGQFRSLMAIRRKSRAYAKDTSDKPGILKRNINTLQGREPGYVAPKDEKDMQRGGKVGKAARAVLTGLSGYGSMAE